MSIICFSIAICLPVGGQGTRHYSHPSVWDYLSWLVSFNYYLNHLTQRSYGFLFLILHLYVFYVSMWFLSFFSKCKKYNYK